MFRCADFLQRGIFFVISCPSFSLRLTINSIYMEFISQYGLEGLLIGFCTFLIIGLFHPIVIKGEYYFGTQCWWCFLVAGIVFLCLSVAVDGIFLSAIFGVLAFSSFWSILEIFEQAERVRKGWFPRNPKRHYSFDDTKESDR